MSQANTLLQERASVWGQMQDLDKRALDEKRALTSEENEQWDRMDEQIQSFDKRIARIQAEEERDRKLETTTTTTETTTTEPTDEEREAAYGSAYMKWVRGGASDLEGDEKKLLQERFVTPGELRAQGVASGAAGGYLVPTTFRQKFIEALKFFGAVRDVAEVIETDTGNTIQWPTNDDTANKGAILAENTQVTEQDVTLGQADLGAYMYTSKLVRVSLQLLQDAAFPLETWLPRKLGERIARIQNEHFTTGTGTAQPEGIQTNATIGKTGTTGQTTSVTYDDLVDLIHSVDVAYRNARSRFMAHDLSLATVRKLKDSQNRPLWEPSLQVGTPDSLLGYPLTINNDMPVMAANAKSVLFGDFFAGYVIRDVTGVQVLRLEERYADYLQVGFLAFQRSDATPQDTAAYKAYRNSAT